MATPPRTRHRAQMDTAGTCDQMSPDEPADMAPSLPIKMPEAKHQQAMQDLKVQLDQANELNRTLSQQQADQQLKQLGLDAIQQRKPMPAAISSAPSTDTSQHRLWFNSGMVLHIAVVLLALLAVMTFKLDLGTSIMRFRTGTARISIPHQSTTTDDTIQVVYESNPSGLPSQQASVFSADQPTVTHNPISSPLPDASLPASLEATDINHHPMDPEYMHRRLEHMRSLHDAMQQRLAQKLSQAQHRVADAADAISTTSTSESYMVGRVEEFHPLRREAPVRERMVPSRKVFQPVILAIKTSQSARVVVDETPIPSIDPICLPYPTAPQAGQMQWPAHPPVDPEAVQAMQQRLEVLRNRHDAMQQRLEQRLTRARQVATQAAGSDGNALSEPKFGGVQAFQPLPRVAPGRDESKVQPTSKGSLQAKHIKAPKYGKSDDKEKPPVKHKPASFYQSCPCSRNRKKA